MSCWIKPSTSTLATTMRATFTLPALMLKRVNDSNTLTGKLPARLRRPNTGPSKKIFGWRKKPAKKTTIARTRANQFTSAAVATTKVGAGEAGLGALLNPLLYILF